mgnify:CR=1 FL=1
MKASVWIRLWAVCGIACASLASEIPRLEKRGSATQLIVDGQPFLMLAGELHNSSSASLAYLETIWPKLQKLNLNTVLAPVSWEQLEPEEGRFDFALVDGLVRQARQRGMRLVLLWFGSWKNGVSSYAPEWVKRDTVRFPRAKGSSNRNTKDILSTLSDANRQADARAFAALMRRLREIDGRRYTVILIQVENEVGIKPEPRDLSEAADAAFAGAVPGELMGYLASHKTTLHPELLKRWEAGGFKTAGTWAEVFGGSPGADEVFSVWCYARYINEIARAGKKEYPLPMYVNAWLPSPGAPAGNYPSGGPVGHMLEIWRAGAPDVDLFAPDIYRPDFREVCDEYVRNGNPLVIPETRRDEDACARAYWTFGARSGLCFSPFGIESVPDDHPLRDAYAVLAQLAPLIGPAQAEGRVTAAFQQDPAKDKAEEALVLGEWNVLVKYVKDGLPRSGRSGALILQTEKEEFLVAGLGAEIGFGARTPGPRQTGILSVEMGHVEKGKFVCELKLNGDETAANNRARLPPNPHNLFLDPARPRILRVRVYRHD